MTIQKIISGNSYKQGSVITGVNKLGNYSSITPILNEAVDLIDLDNFEYSIIATGAGASSSIFIPEGKWSFAITASSWGQAHIEISIDGTNWIDAEEFGTVVSLTGNAVKNITGNKYIRLYVDTYSANITLFIKRADNDN